MKKCNLCVSLGFVFSLGSHGSVEGMRGGLEWRAVGQCRDQSQCEGVLRVM